MLIQCSAAREHRISLIRLISLIFTASVLETVRGAFDGVPSMRGVKFERRSAPMIFIDEEDEFDEEEEELEDEYDE